MKALVTGASSGIGYEIAKYLSKLGHDIIAVARDEERLRKLQEECKTDVQIKIVDLSNRDDVIKLSEETANEEIDILVNNAGFGAFGQFDEIDFVSSVKMIGVNIEAFQILTYKYISKMKKKNKGYILNIGSIAGFMPGPLMTEYYATKAYVLRLTQGISKELKKQKSNVSISVCCPGPVNTNFNKVANVKFSLKSKTSDFVAKKAVDGMFKKKTIICPGVSEKLVRMGRKLLSDNILAEIAYYVQKRKCGR